MVSRLGRSRFVVAAASVAMLSSSMGLAQSPAAGAPPPPSVPRPATMVADSLPPPAGADLLARPPADVGGSLDEARELIKSGDYDRAIEVLSEAIQKARSQMVELREAYLLLIKTRVTYGNYLKSQPQGRAAAQDSYEQARRTIAECLRTPGLRHTRPEPESEYPPEMIGFFRDVRGQIFGSFRIADLTPAGAIATLDADTLAAADRDSLGDTDIAVGPHVVIVRATGYRTLTEDVEISPSSTLERSYRLTKKRTARWYAATLGGAAAVVGGVIALAGGKKTTTSVAQPLPGPPNPPASAH